MPGLDLDAPLTPEEKRNALDSIAKNIVARRLETPALFLLEINKPLAYVASQALLCAMPFVGPIAGAEKVVGLSRLLRDRDSIDLLMERIQELVAQRDASKNRRPQDHSSALT